MLAGASHATNHSWLLPLPLGRPKIDSSTVPRLPLRRLQTAGHSCSVSPISGFPMSFPSLATHTVIICTPFCEMGHPLLPSMHIFFPLRAHSFANWCTLSSHFVQTSLSFCGHFALGPCTVFATLRTVLSDFVHSFLPLYKDLHPMPCRPLRTLFCHFSPIMGCAVAGRTWIGVSLVGQVV